MVSIVVEPLWRLVKLLWCHDAPAQIAGGFTLGAIIGLVPMNNLITVGLCVLLGALRVNRTAAGLGVLIFVWLGALADPYVHAIGQQVLNIEALQTTFASLYELPLGPWIGFHNTVVLGSFLLGVYFAYPVFWLTFAACMLVKGQLTRIAHRRQLRRLVASMNIGAQWGAAS